MSHARTSRPNKAPATYKELAAAFPLRPLHDEVDYDNALEVAESLVGLARPTADQADYLDVLTDIIQKYEAAHYAVGDKSDPIQTLKAILEEHDMTGSDLGRLLGNRQLGSLILTGRRELSKTHIRTLADHFNVSADLFLG